MDTGAKIQIRITTAIERRARHIEHLQLQLRTRQFMRRTRSAMLFLLAMAVPAMPWMLMIGPIVVIVLFIFGIRRDWQEIERITGELEDLEMFKVWIMLANRLANSRTLDEGRKTLAAATFQTFAQEFMGVGKRAN